MKDEIIEDVVITLTTFLVIGMLIFVQYLDGVL